MGYLPEKTRTGGVPRVGRRGFTMVELLVTMTIILILAGIAIAAVNFAAQGDRIPGAARQTQSMIMGARDRAIYAGEPRGVRLVLDPNNNRLVNSFVFVGAPQSYGRGQVSVYEYPPTSGQWWATEVDPGESQWRRLASRGLLARGQRITIGEEEKWYTIAEGPQFVADLDLTGQGPQQGGWSLRLSRAFTGTPDLDLEYSATLAPAPLPGEEPRALGSNVVIDLDSSRGSGKLPSWWWSNNGTPGDPTDDHYITEMDIMFNERGTAHGPIASQGVVSLLIVDAVDYQTGFRVGHPNVIGLDVNGDGTPGDEREGDERVVSFFAASGTMLTAPVDETDVVNNSTGAAVPDQIRDDPFRIAETGGED